MVPRALPEAPEKAEKGFPEHLEKAVDYRQQGGGGGGNSAKTCHAADVGTGRHLCVWSGWISEMYIWELRKMLGFLPCWIFS